MCGVVGLLNCQNEEANRFLVTKMVDSLQHRGPDASCVWSDDTITLGHARLSMLDLSDDANQPMISDCGRYALVFNGEIYNYLELKKKLRKSHKTHSDTEVLLYFIIEFGFHGIAELNGMFAGGFWDKKEKKLTLFRDRYGIKPLYILTYDDGISFSSEQKSFYAIPQFLPRLDHEALSEYLVFQNILSDKTLFKNVELLKPGTYSVFSHSNGYIERQDNTFWEHRLPETYAPLSKHGYRTIQDKFLFLLEQAVGRTLRSDVELGAFLSGGLDSSAVSYFSSKRQAHLKTFTVGFDTSSASGLELLFDERDKAEEMSAYLGTEHYETVLKAGDMERSIDQVVYHLEEPRVGQCYPNFYAAKLASKFVKGVLSGVGGDEILGGYPWRYHLVDKTIDFLSFVKAYFKKWQRLLNQDEISQICNLSSSFRPHQDHCFETFVSMFPRGMEHVSSHSSLDLSILFETNTFLRGLLIVEDKISMAHGLESRVPFLDNDLYDFCIALPPEIKTNLAARPFLDENDHGPKLSLFEQRNGQGKLLMREALRSIVPETVCDRRKQGFSSPDGSWFRGESLQFVGDVLGSPNARIYQLLERNTVQELLNQHISGKVNRRLLIWGLIYLERWFERFRPSI